ncbi:MAG: SulP family inorganic anion transporter [Verrucomicrobiota bacterium]
MSIKLTRLFPGLALFRGYRRRWLASDILAGVSVTVVMIPSVIAYAGLIGIPPEYGLYAALVPLLVYPLLGSSRQVIVGPDIAISLLIASAVGPLAGGDPGRAAVLAAIIALLSGILLLLGARAKFGAAADFLSKPVLVGYMTGAALILMSSQLGTLFGVPIHHTEFFPLLSELAGKLSQTNRPTLLLGILLLCLLNLLRRVAPKMPGALVACAVALGVSWAMGLRAEGVAVVGSFKGGLPAFSIPEVSLRDIHGLLPAALGIALLTYTECILLARAFGAKNQYKVDATQELVALGWADVVTGLFQGFSVTGSQSRTTINDAFGGKTQLVSFVAAGALALFILFLTPMIASLPKVALAAILIYAGFSLVEFDVMRRIYGCYPRSGLLAAITTAGVLAAGVIPGILFGVVISLVGLINRISRPMDAVLQPIPSHGFHDIGENPTGQTVPGLIAYRFYAPLLFSNAEHFVEHVRQLVANSPTRVRWFLLDAQAITDIDVTAAESLRILMKELHRKGVELKIARANRPLREILERSGVTRELGEKNFFPSVHKAIEAFQGLEPL